MHPMAVRDGVEPVLRVCLSSAIPDEAHPDFSLDTLAYIRFMSEGGQFQPLISSEYQPQTGTQTQMKQDYVSNFLLFKGFEKDSQEHPHYTVTSQGIREGLRSFVADVYHAPTPKQIELMEFEAGRSPGYDELMKLQRAKKRAGFEFPEATYYFGTDVIRRLMYVTR